VRVAAGEASRSAIEGALRPHVAGIRFGRAATARQGTTLELAWTVQSKPETDPIALVALLNGVPGVQHAEIDSV
jgi:hypothetical protein